MLTPRFELSQTDDEITVSIYAPFANIAETEVFVAEEHFRFFSSPYFLRLHLPGLVEETDASSGRYESDSGKFIITVSKVTKGEHFPNLDLLTTLLAPRKQNPVIGKAGIEVISSTENPDGDEEGHVDSSDSEWFMDQKPEEPFEPLLLTEVKYGFANQCSHVLQNLKHEISEIIDLRDPDTTPASMRPQLQAEAETEHFSDDHYLADYMEDDTVRKLLVYYPACHPEVHWTPEEQDILKELPNREYLLSQPEQEGVYYCLTDILFAFCYNRRTNEGENNAESAWLINKLSATLSWLQTFPNLAATLKSCFRRSLVYPLFRNYDLAVVVAIDVQTVLNAGKKQVLKCLLEIYSLFNLSEPRYLLNQLYIKDFCVWIQQCSEQRLCTLADNFIQALPNKADLNLDLVELEAAAKLVQAEENVIQASQLLLSLVLTTPSPKGSESDTSQDSESDSDSSTGADSTLGSDEPVRAANHQGQI